MAISSWLLAASLAPVWVKCHHADCVITCRIRASADAILVATLIASGVTPPNAFLVRTRILLSRDFTALTVIPSACAHSS
jgi:hypothetical protein